MDTLILLIISVLLLGISSVFSAWRLIRLERKIGSIDRHVEYDLKARMGEDSVAYSEQRGHAYGKRGQEGGREGVQWKWTDYRDTAIDYFLMSCKRLKVETSKEDAFLHVEAALGRIRGRGNKLIRLADRDTEEASTVRGDESMVK